MRRYFIPVLLTLCTYACKTPDKMKEFKVLVLNDTGEVLEHVAVTPISDSHHFKTAYTGIDGIADLNGIYAGTPKKIVVRLAGYRAKSVEWQLPLDKPQSIVMFKLNIPN